MSQREPESTGMRKQPHPHLLTYSLTDLRIHSLTPSLTKSLNHSSLWSRGQGALEYTALLTIVIAALVAMRIYVKRGFAGMLEGAANSLGSQFDPRNTTGLITSTTSANTTTTSQSLNEPQLSGGVVCVDLNKDSQCDCIDLGGSPGCTDTHIYGEISEVTLNNETQRTEGTETVGPLGTDLWEQ